MADMKKIEQLFRLAKRYRVAEFELEESKFKVRFRFREKGSHASSIQVAAGASRDSGAQTSSSVEKDPSAKTGAPWGAGPKATASGATPPVHSVQKETYHKITSPFVGTFYRSPSPEADPYVQEGQVISKGDVLCIVEAMKLMNEIESEVAGKVISVLVENGQPVEYGEPLFLVDRSS